MLQLTIPEHHCNHDYPQVETKERVEELTSKLTDYLQKMEEMTRQLGDLQSKQTKSVYYCTVEPLVTNIIYLGIKFYTEMTVVEGLFLCPTNSFVQHLISWFSL